MILQRKLSNLQRGKLKKKKDTQRFREVLNGFRKRCGEELAYHEMSPVYEWNPANIDILEVEYVIEKLQKFEALLRERSDLKQRPVSTKSEEQHLNSLIADIDEMIETLFQELDSQFSITEIEKIDKLAEEKNETGNLIGNKKSNKRLRKREETNRYFPKSSEQTINDGNNEVPIIDDGNCEKQSVDAEKLASMNQTIEIDNNKRVDNVTEETNQRSEPVSDTIFQKMNGKSDELSSEYNTKQEDLHNNVPKAKHFKTIIDKGILG